VSTSGPSRRRRPTRRPTGRKPERSSAATADAFPIALHDPTPVEFGTLDLDERLMTALGYRGFERTTPVQSAVFPLVSAGVDLIACAQTGTGKTAAFLLPVLQRLLAQADPKTDQLAPGTRMLVLAPTRELAAQIEEDLDGFAYGTPISGMAVYGGVAMDNQERALRAGVHVVVATPGRLIDHMNGGVADFSQLQVLVLDEADRMLDMGFWPDVRRIVSALPTERQTLLFSATTSEDVVQLAGQVMKDPQLVRIGRPSGLATTLTHEAHMVPASQKADWLARYLQRVSGPSLVFVRTKRGADRLARRLVQSHVRCVALHADRTQAERQAAVEGFRSGRYRVMVATDIAARGLDIDGIAQVINYEVPDGADGYVHRVGRTGRADASGIALTLASPDELRTLRSIERTLKLQLLKDAEPPVPSH
jgi:ATP-dependent RNA helicase RhlE